VDRLIIDFEIAFIEMRIIDIDNRILCNIDNEINIIDDKMRRVVDGRNI
jgi:hypothetical protein